MNYIHTYHIWAELYAAEFIMVGIVAQNVVIVYLVAFVIWFILCQKWGQLSVESFLVKWC